MIDRITQIMEEKKLSAKQFSDAIGIQRSSLSHVLSGRNKPSLDFMLKIKNRFPDINLEWLLMGKGEMRSAYENMLESREKHETAEPITSSFSKPKPKGAYKYSPTGDKSSEQETRKEEEKEVFRSVQRPMKSKPSKIILLYDDNTFETFSYRQE